MSPNIREARPNDAAAISQLVQSSFGAYVAPDWEPTAQEMLLADTSAEKLAARMAESVVVLVYEEGTIMLGVILLPRPTLLQLCFVAPGHVGKGIGRSLWEAARARVEDRFPEARTIELNASPFAVAAYKAWGFYPISEPFVRGGAVATRMACWLPGRALAKAQAAMRTPDGLSLVGWSDSRHLGDETST